MLKRDLLEALQRVKGTTADSKMIQLYKCFCFMKGKVLGYNGQAGTVTLSPLGMEADFCIEREIFYKQVSAMFDEIHITLDQNAIHMKSGSNKTKLQIIPTRGYPDIIPTDATEFCEASNVVSCLERVSFTIGTNASKPQLLGACLSGDYVYSSDGQRISRAKLNRPCSGGLTLPGPSVEQICKLGIAEQILTTRGVGGLPTKAVFRYMQTNTFYVTAVLAAEFPCKSVDAMLAAPLNEEYTTDFPEEFPQAIDRISALTNEDVGIVVQNIPGIGLYIKAATTDVGTAEETLVWDFKAPFKFGVRADRIKKAFMRTRKVDLSDVCVGQNRQIRFSDTDFDHILALMLVHDNQ